MSEPGLDPLLIIEKVGAGYGSGLVVSGIDLSVSPGKVHSIVGPNGSGKSTLLKAIAGQIETSVGRELLAGEDVTRLSTEMRVARGLGYVPQINDVFAPLTVEDNLCAGGYLLPKREVRRRAEEVLDFFPALRGLRQRLAGRLSGGERKMLAMGRVLMLRPKVLLLDEPTANLSPQNAHVVLARHLVRLAAAGCAILLVEQRVTEALAVADWACVLVGGRIQASGPGGELLARPDIGELFLGGQAKERANFRTSSTSSSGSSKAAK